MGRRFWRWSGRQRFIVIIAKALDLVRYGPYGLVAAAPAATEATGIDDVGNFPEDHYLSVKVAR